MSDRAVHVIEVFADIWCPFAYVGLRTVDEQRVRRGRTDVRIQVRAWPLELVNGAPLDPSVTKAHVDELREQVAPSLFGSFDPQHFPRSTLDPLALAARAYRADLLTGERVSFALRDALFERGEDISSRAVLERIAAEFDVGWPAEVDRSAVMDDWREGQRRGVLGSPHFFCGDSDVFCPSLEISKEPGHGLSIARDGSRLRTFLERCLSDADSSALGGPG